MLGARAAYWLAAGIIGLVFWASVTPSPLYGSYSQLWHFSPLTLTLIYATYAFGVLATLLVAGRVSDQVGRRPVLLVSLGALIVSTLLFIGASSPAWLFVARGLQGLATGAALSTASAALLDLHPRHDATRVAQANAVAGSAGIALGIMVSAALVQRGFAPLVMPYVLLLLLFAVAVAGVYAMPEPVRTRGRLELKLQRPRLPAAVRRPFLHASLAVLASWSIGGLFFSLGPQLAGRVFHTSNVVVAVSGIVLLGACAAVAQLVLGRIRPWRAASIGSMILAVGTLVLVRAAASESGVAFLLGAGIAGIGFGLGFLGGLRALLSVIPPDQRAGVMSAFYLVAYASLSIPAVVVGFVVGHVGLVQTFEAFGYAVAVVALVLAVEAWRTRPA